MNLNRLCLFFAIIAPLSVNSLLGMKKISKNFSTKKFPVWFKNKELNFNKNLFFNAWSRQKRSIFHYTEYKGLEDAFTCEKLKEQASPWRGITLIESNLLRNLYEYGPEDTPVVELLNNKKYGFFHLLANDFRHTQINPACGLTPELTAHIVAASIKGMLELPETKEEIVKIWRENYKQERPSQKVGKRPFQEQLDLIIKVQQEGLAQESERIFPQDFGISLLLAHLYRKGTKQDVLRYLNALTQHFPEKIDVQALMSMGKLSYTPCELNDYFNQARTHAFKTFFEDPFKATAAILYSKSIVNLYPPHAVQGTYGFLSKPGRPDCCETGIRNFCNLLLASPQGTCFELSLLPETIKPLQTFIEFYTQFSDYATVQSKEAGQAWMNLVSGHKGIKYDQGDYELYSSLDNVLAVVNILLQTEAKNFEELGTLLSTRTRSVSLQASNNGLKVKIYDIEKQQLEMILATDPGFHTVTTFGVKHKNSTKRDELNDLLRILEEDSSENFAEHALPFLIKDVHDISTSMSSSSPIIYNYSKELSNVNDRVDAIKKLSTQYTFRSYFDSTFDEENSIIRSSIISLCKTLPYEDIYIMGKVFANLIDSDLLRHEKWLQDLAEQHLLGFIRGISLCEGNLLKEDKEKFYFGLLDKSVHIYLDKINDIRIANFEFIRHLCEICLKYQSIEQIFEGLLKRFLHTPDYCNLVYTILHKCMLVDTMTSYNENKNIDIAARKKWFLNLALNHPREYIAAIHCSYILSDEALVCFLDFLDICYSKHGTLADFLRHKELEQCGTTKSKIHFLLHTTDYVFHEICKKVEQADLKNSFLPKIFRYILKEDFLKKGSWFINFAKRHYKEFLNALLASSSDISDETITELFPDTIEPALHALFKNNRGGEAISAVLKSKLFRKNNAVAQWICNYILKNDLCTQKEFREFFVQNSIAINVFIDKIFYIHSDKNRVKEYALLFMEIAKNMAYNDESLSQYKAYMFVLKKLQESYEGRSFKREITLNILELLAKQSDNFGYEKNIFNKLLQSNYKFHDLLALIFVEDAAHEIMTKVLTDKLADEGEIYFNENTHLCNNFFKVLSCEVQPVPIQVVNTIAYAFKRVAFHHKDSCKALEVLTQVIIDHDRYNNGRFLCTENELKNLLIENPYSHREILSHTKNSRTYLKENAHALLKLKLVGPEKYAEGRYKNLYTIQSGWNKKYQLSLKESIKESVNQGEYSAAVKLLGVWGLSQL